MTKPFTRQARLVLLYRCNIQNNTKDGISLIGCRANLYGCTVQNNEGAIVRIDSEQTNQVQIFLKTKSDDLLYAGRQQFQSALGRFKPPLIVNQNVSKAFKDCID